MSATWLWRADPAPAGAASPGAAPPGRQWRRPSRKLLAVFLLGAVAGWGSLALLPAVPAHVGPGTVEVSVRPALVGSTMLDVPPLGTLSAQTHHAPLGITARITSVDLAGLGKKLTGRDPAAEFSAEAHAQIIRLLLLLAGISCVGAMGTGLLVGLVVPGRNLRTAAAGVAGAATLLTATLGATAATFNETALRAPTFHGSLAALPELMTVTQNGNVLGRQVTSRLQVFTDQIQAAYHAANNVTADRPSDVTVLHVSDIQSNPVGVALTVTLARSLHVSAVLDTGDLTAYGSALEKGLVAGITAVQPITGAPYLLVGGNQDSPGVRSQLAALPGVKVLDGQSITLGTGRNAIRLLGIGDPTFTGDGSMSAAQAGAVKSALAGQVAAEVRAAHPTVLALHDPASAADVAGLVPVVLTGHDRQRSWADRQGTVFAGVGSTGAGGIGAQLAPGGGHATFEAQMLRFRDGHLIAVDYIRMPGATGEFTVTRTLVAEQGRAELSTDAQGRPQPVPPLTGSTSGRSPLVGTGPGAADATPAATVAGPPAAVG